MEAAFRRNVPVVFALTRAQIGLAFGCANKRIGAAALVDVPAHMLTEYVAFVWLAAAENQAALRAADPRDPVFRNLLRLATRGERDRVKP